MRKYIEFGIGNRWFIRTEIEHQDGSESEYFGFKFPIHPTSMYLRVWVGRTVFIFDLKKGFNIKKKSVVKFKFLVGITCYLPDEELVP